MTLRERATGRWWLSEQVCGDSFSWTHRPMYDLHLQGLLTALVVCRALTITYNLQAD